MDGRGDAKDSPALPKCLRACFRSTPAAQNFSFQLWQLFKECRIRAQPGAVFHHHFFSRSVFADHKGVAPHRCLHAAPWNSSPYVDVVLCFLTVNNELNHHEITASELDLRPDAYLVVFNCHNRTVSECSN